MPHVDFGKLTGDRIGESSDNICTRVELSRKKQHTQFAGMDLQCNGDMGPGEVRRFCEVNEAGKTLLRAAMQQMQLSARAYHRILMLARTIADLAGCEKIENSHIAEAIQYRPRKQF